MKLGILIAFDRYHKYYIRACEELKVEYELIDIIAPDWFKQVSQSNCDGFLCRPPSKFQERKAMFDERLFIISNKMNRRIYPTWEELYLYENKRMTSYWLELYDFPRPKTQIFYRKSDYLDFIKNADYPFVIKSNTGSTAKGVSIIKNHTQARRLAGKYFGYFNPKLARGHTFIKTGRFIPVTSHGSKEKHYIITQKFEKIKWEWRIVKIGESYFGHKKLLAGYFASGSFLKGWEAPPTELLHLVKKICETGGFYSMAADIFETADGRFMVNELQSLFGQKTANLMLVNNVPGRFIEENGAFVFEKGEFNQHQSYTLRVRHFLEILKSRQNKSA